MRRRGGAQPVKDRVMAAVADVSEKVRTRAEKLADEQKHRAASELEGVGRSIRDAAGRLQAGPLRAVGGYVEAAAERVTQASRYLEEQDLESLVIDAEDAVRRVPQWFLPGMFLAGLALARFVKATENETAHRGRPGASGRRQPPRAR